MRYKIADMYRRHIKALEYRCVVMSELFEDEVYNLVKNIQKQSKQKKVKGVEPKKTNKSAKLVIRLLGIPKAMKNRVLCLYMARMKFFYTVKTLKWFMTYRSYTYADESAVKERDELIEQRAKQLYEIDMVLFDKVDMPVLIPDRIIESQKALAKK